MDAIVFYLSGVLSLVAAALVVTRKNPVYSTIYLVIFFLLISLDYLILRAPFLAVVQVLIYAGAIMVLFLFVIMLLNLTPEELKEKVSSRRKGFAAALSLGVFGLLAFGIARSPTVERATDLTAAVPPAVATAGETASIGHALFSTHALAFEYTSILILVAIVGAIFLTKKRSKVGSKAGVLALTGLENQEAAQGYSPTPESATGKLAQGSPARSSV